MAVQGGAAARTLSQTRLVRGADGRVLGARHLGGREAVFGVRAAVLRLLAHGWWCRCRRWVAACVARKGFVLVEEPLVVQRWGAFGVPEKSIINKMGGKTFYYRSWIRDVFCTQHLQVLGTDSKIHLKSRLLVPF